MGSSGFLADGQSLPAKQTTKYPQSGCQFFLFPVMPSLNGLYTSIPYPWEAGSVTLTCRWSKHYALTNQLRIHSWQSPRSHHSHGKGNHTGFWLRVPSLFTVKPELTCLVQSDHLQNP